MEKIRILVIEDDPTISELLAYNLQSAGYEVMVSSDGCIGLETALTCDIDLAIVDLMLPTLDGLSINREISRKKPDLPLIVLTALTDRDVVLDGFDSGADDFVTKPFDIDELLARIAARLRRVQRDEAEPKLRLEGIELDHDRHMLVSSGGDVFLKPKEFDLLELLLSKPGHLFPREEISSRVWHQQYVSTSRTLDVHVRHVRAKLESVDAPARIENVRGVGYRLAPEDEAIVR